MNDEENPNLNEEEYDEENMLNQNQNELEHQEQEDEEGQDIYAFDIQINEDLYLLVIGKTEEKEMIEENKPSSLQIESNQQKNISIIH